MTATTNNALGNGIRLISRHRWFVLLTTIVVTVAVVGLNSVLNDFEYRADAQLLVVQYSDSASVDGEKTLRSTENISRNLTKIIDTSSFINAALQSGKIPNGTIEGVDELSRKESWSQKVTASSVPNSSIIKVSVYDTNPQRAIVLAQVVSDTMIAKASEYHGAAKGSIEVKQIDNVVVSPKPVRPNIPLAAVSGVLVGFLVSVTYLFMVKEWKLVGLFLHYWRKTEQMPYAYAPEQRAVEQLPQVPVAEVPPVQYVQEYIPEPQVMYNNEQFEQQPVYTGVQEVVEVPVEQPVEEVVEPAVYQVLDHQNYSESLRESMLRLPSMHGNVVAFAYAGSAA